MPRSLLPRGKIKIKSEISIKYRDLLVSSGQTVSMAELVKVVNVYQQNMVINVMKVSECNMEPEYPENPMVKLFNEVIVQMSGKFC